MITIDQQKQVDAAMELLSSYITKEPWEEWMVEVFTDAIAYAAEMLELSADEVLDYLEEQPLGQMAHAHVFEHFVTTETNEDGESVLKEFIRTRVQEDKSSFACQYLHALSESELALWEVTDVKSGKASVKRMGSDEAAVQVPLEAERMPKNLCIAARLLTLPNGEYTFGFGLLPVERKEAEDILAYLQQVRAEMEETARTDGHGYEAEDIEEAMHEEMLDLMFHETLAAWISQGFE